MLRSLLILTILAWLGGCATPAQVTVGTPAAELKESLGKPNAVHPLPTGQRLFYGDRSLQQEAWRIDLDREGKVVAILQVHSREGFAQVRSGVDTTETVRLALGEPWNIARYAPSGLTAWLYPYREDGVWNSMMGMLFDDDGRLVRMENGPDPRFLGGGNDRS